MDSTIHLFCASFCPPKQKEKGREDRASLLLTEQAFVPDEPRIVKEAYDVLGYDLADNQGYDWHDTVEGYRNEDDRVECQVNYVAH